MDEGANSKPDSDNKYLDMMAERYNSKPDPKKGFQNTDPYVFGKCFYYSCCRQNKENQQNEDTPLKKLKTGDLIIFYGGDEKEGKKKVRLDTVFVVGEKYYEYGKDSEGRIYFDIVDGSKKTRYYNAKIKDIIHIIPVSEAYLNGVLNAIWFGHDANKEEYSFILYSGATKDHSVNGMFSYFICKTEDDEGNKGFPRMSYDVDSPLDNDFGFSYSLQAAKYQVIIRKNTPGKPEIKIPFLKYANCNDVKQYWSRLTQDIMDRGYRLGISADEPKDKSPVIPQKD